MPKKKVKDMQEEDEENTPRAQRDHEIRRELEDTYSDAEEKEYRKQQNMKKEQRQLMEQGYRKL